MEKKIYDERALRTFKANFEKVKANLMHVHECDLGSVDFRSELIVQLYKACDYRCLYLFMPVHGMTMMERCRLISKCSDYIVRDFIFYFLNGKHFERLRRCCDGLFRDGDIEDIELGGLDEAEVKIYSEILKLKKPQLWFAGLSDELKREFDEERREILDWYCSVDEDGAITEVRIMKLMEWYCLGWTTVLEWVKDNHRLDELKRFIWDTYVKKDTSVVARKELEEHIEFCSDDEGWWLDESFEAVYNCREQIRKWFDDPKVQKDFLLSGKEIGGWLKEKNNKWQVKCSSKWFHFNGKD